MSLCRIVYRRDVTSLHLVLDFTSPLIVTSTKEVIVLPFFVCLLAGQLKNLLTILMNNIFRQVECLTSNRRLDFGDDPHYDADPVNQSIKFIISVAHCRLDFPGIL